MSLTNKVAQFDADSDLVNAWVHGPASGAGSTITTESGTVRTPAKLIADKEAEINVDAAGVLALSTAQADISTAQAVIATIQKDLAVTAKTAAEIAASNALISAGSYVDEPTGRAAVADGVAFKVQSTGDVAAYEYRRTNSTTSVLIASYPSKSGVDLIAESVAAKAASPGGLVSYRRIPTGRYKVIGNGVAWGFGFFPIGKVISRITTILIPAATTKYARVRVYSRTDPADVAVPASAGDTLMREVLVDLTDLLGTQSIERREVSVAVTFLPLVVSPATPVIVTIEGLTDAMAVSIIGISSAAYESGAPTINQGWTKTEGGSFNLIGSTQAWPAVTVDDGDVAASATTVASAYEDLVYYPSAVTTWNDAAWAGWATSFPEYSGVTFDAITAMMGRISQNSQVQVRIYARIVGGSSSAAPGASDSDLPIAVVRVAASGLATNTDLTKVTIPVGSITIPAGYYPIIECSGIKAGGLRGEMGVGQASYGSAPPQSSWSLSQAGTQYNLVTGNRSAAFGLSLSVQAPTDAENLAIKVRVSAVEQTSALHTSQISSLEGLVSGVGISDNFSPILDIVGRVVNLTGSTAVLDGVATSFSGSFTLARPTTSAETVTNYTLKYAPSGAVLTANANAMLWRRRLSNVVVTRQSDSVVLTAGVHYGVDAIWGKLYGLGNTADFLVNVSFTYERERYDLLQIDPVTLTTSVVTGTERDVDAHEYLPVQSARNLPLFLLYVHEESVTAVPVHKFDKGVRRDSRAVFNSLLADNKAVLPKTLGKLRRGLPIKMTGYGDSITAHGGKDLYWYFELLPADTKATIARYDRGDSGGTWAVKTSYVWVAKLAIEAAYSIAIDYFNAGISSTNSSSSTNNGLDPARLNPVLANGSDLMVLAFGMNELGTDTTYANITSIIAQAKAAGMEVVVMAVPKTNAVTNLVEANWHKTNRTLQLAAVDAGAAFCPTHWLTDQGGGGLPVAPDHLCSSNFFNHPGITENRVYGEMLARMFL